MYKSIKNKIKKSLVKTLIVQAWNNAEAVEGYDENYYRKEANGNWISLADYGNTNSNLGWELAYDKNNRVQAVQWAVNRKSNPSLDYELNHSRKFIATNYWV